MNPDQINEIDSLKAVYGDSNVAFKNGILRVELEPNFIIQCKLPIDYPEKVPPVALGKYPVELTDKFIQGEEVLLTWLEAIRESNINSEEREEDNSIKISEDVTFTTEKPKESTQELDSTFHTGIAISANKSKFQAHAARCKTPLEALAKVKCVQNSKYSRATHNIWAYRLADGRADNDDDGESAAGGRLAELLYLIDAKDVVVVVSRWYGGVNVGPQRFKYILQAARDAIDNLPA